jgi:hypothetical protein
VTHAHARGRAVLDAFERGDLVGRVGRGAGAALLRGPRRALTDDRDRPRSPAGGVQRECVALVLEQRDRLLFDLAGECSVLVDRDVLR